MLDLILLNHFKMSTVNRKDTQYYHVIIIYHHLQLFLLPFLGITCDPKIQQVLPPGVL